jgi:hypothetical protein
MTSRFMISVAALALIAGTGFANAQGTGTSREGASSGSSVQQSAPSSPSSAPSSATPTTRNETNHSDTQDKGAAKTTQSEEKMQPGGAKNQRAQGEMKAGQKSEKSAQDNIKGDNIKGEKSKSMSSENDGAKAGKDMKAEGREGRDGKMNAQGREDRNTAQGREDRMNAEQKGAAGTQSQTTVTTGQAGAGAKLAPEQRTKITTVIREQHVQPVTNVNFEIRTGVRIPRERDVKFYPLPQEVVTIYPQWRGYEYILVKDKIVVVDPRTFEIVDVLDV